MAQVPTPVYWTVAAARVQTPAPLEHLRVAQPWAYDWEAAPAFDRAAYQELAESLRRELTRMGVTKPMRFDPGANADAAS